jgi:peptide/nickel transport system ATP-binding protein
MTVNEDKKLLSVKNLEVHYITRDETVYAVNGVSFDLDYGDAMGLVGETGAGKTTIAKSIMRILPDPPAKTAGGEIFLDGTDILKISEEEMKKLRGKRLAMVFQDPMTALNPVKRIGWQITEGIWIHEKTSWHKAEEKAMEILELVGIPKDRFNEYPHQFSGGMKQRVVIAIALACNPDLLICDEPTSALDVTIQAQVLDIIKKLKEQENTAMILITHDFGVVAKSCNYVGVLYAGEIVEFGTLSQVFRNPMHPYTKGLFASIPNLVQDAKRLKPIYGLPPDPANLPKGCKFMPRCHHAKDKCKSPVWVFDSGDGHQCKCCLYGIFGG